MSRIERGSAFVVVTGNPEEGQGKRLSEVRSHMAKRHHQHRIRQDKSRTRICLHRVEARSLRALRNIPRELHIALDSPRLPSSPTGYRRMQQFMYQYVHYSHQIHPFFATVICAAVSHPALMSSKILNASTWDDISTSGNISDLTFQQCNITRRLLSQTLENREIALSDMNIAALIAILLFDLVGDEDAFHLDYEGIRTIIDARGGMENLGFEGHLKNTLLLIEELKRAVGIMPMPSLEGLSFPTSPLEITVFSLGIDKHGSDTSDSSPMPSVLANLYQSVMILKHCDCYATASDGSFDQSIPWLARDWQPMTALGDGGYPPNDARIPALLQTIQILNWCSASSCTVRGLSIALFNLKSLLETTDLESFWNFLPGALIWCLTIGVRMCPPGSLRKWFLMQTMRVSCTMAMHHADAVLKSLQTVLEGLDGVKHKDVEYFHNE